MARACGRVFAAVTAAGRKARRRRAFDLLIAATTLAAGLPLYTRNPDDFADLSDMIRIVTIRGSNTRPRTDLPTISVTAR